MEFMVLHTYVCTYMYIHIIVQVQYPAAERELLRINAKSSVTVSRLRTLSI